MAKGKKYNYQLTQDNDSWSVEIIRKVTSKKSLVSKSQDGFASEAEAQQWGENELKLFLGKLDQRNKRHAGQRKSVGTSNTP